MWGTLGKRGPAILLPALVVIAWVGVVAVGGPYFGRLSQVSSSSATRFLPADAESTRVAAIQLSSSGEMRPPAIIVLYDPTGMTPEAKRAFDARLPAINRAPGVLQAVPFLPSPERTEDGLPYGYQSVVLLDGSMPTAVRAIRTELAAVSPAVPPAVPAPAPGGGRAGVTAYVAGPAGLITDMVAAFAGVDGPLLGVALALVLIILVVVYRMPVLPLLVLVTAVAALSAAVVCVYYLAAAGAIVLEPQAQGILFILVVGATTDYALLLTARYREALGEHESARTALRAAWRKTIEPVLASGGTVIAGLLCLLLSGLDSNKGVGPVATLGILAAMVAALTLLPAFLALAGRAAFYPRPPRYGARTAQGVWASVGWVVARSPRRLWLGALASLLVFAAFAPGFDASGTPQAEYTLGPSEARAGEALRGAYFGAGSGTPTVVMTAPASAVAVQAAAATVPGVEGVVPTGGVAGQLLARLGLPVPRSMVTALGRDWASFDVTLAYAEDSQEALATVVALRAAVRSADPDTLVGGGSATTLDTRVTARADLFRIIPLVLVVITLMLALLLRSLLAPVLLVAATMVSYLATLGVASLVFGRVLRLPAADASVPLFGFVFLVALGIDYSIFLVTRVREEALTRGTRAGVLVGLRATGNVLTSAGVVLAATFAALAVIPVVFMVQIAFIVVFGVLLDTFLVRTVLVPGLLHDLGKRSWWPRPLASDGPSAGPLSGP